MAKTIRVDGRINSEHIVSDVEYAGIDWGNTSEDCVRFTDVDGSFIVLNLSHVVCISVPGVQPPPGSYPGWHVYATGLGGSVEGLHVNDATKADIVFAVSEPGSEDSVVEFVSLEGTEVRFLTANVGNIKLMPHDLVVPD